MPQLIPFYYINQLSFTLFAVFVLVYMFSRYILPAFLEVNLSRLYITKIR